MLEKAVANKQVFTLVANAQPEYVHIIDAIVAVQLQKGTMLKLNGLYAYDDRSAAWFEVSYKCKKLWVSKNFVAKDSEGLVYYYNKDGERVEFD